MKQISLLNVDESESEVAQSCPTPWTVAHQAPPSMGFSREEYWSGVPFPPPVALPDLGIRPECPRISALVERFFTTESPGKDGRVPFNLLI